MSKPTDQILGHGADNDGIEEYDNPLPTWWLGLFYFTIVWGAIYFAEYHFVSKRSQAAAYTAEMAAAEALLPRKAQTAAVAVTAPTPELAAAGKAIYDVNCVGCHGPDLHGGVGPDLTDATWIHGGTYENIVKTVTEGVPEKGMITWGPILGGEKIAQVSAYVHGAGGGQ